MTKNIYHGFATVTYVPEGSTEPVTETISVPIHADGRVTLEQFLTRVVLHPNDHLVSARYLK